MTMTTMTMTMTMTTMTMTTRKNGTRRRHEEDIYTYHLEIVDQRTVAAWFIAVNSTETVGRKGSRQHGDES
jgi:hypothetical protein